MDGATQPKSNVICWHFGKLTETVRGTSKISANAKRSYLGT